MLCALKLVNSYFHPRLLASNRAGVGGRTLRALSRLQPRSMATHVTATDGPSFDAAIAAHSGKGAAVLALFTGAHNAEGVSWCPDCNDAQPVIDAAVSAAAGPVTLITVPLPRSEYSGNAAHWARLVGRRVLAMAKNGLSRLQNRRGALVICFSITPPTTYSTRTGTAVRLSLECLPTGTHALDALAVCPLPLQRAPHREAAAHPYALSVGGQWQAACGRLSGGGGQGRRQSGCPHRGKLMVRMVERWPRCRRGAPRL